VSLLYNIVNVHKRHLYINTTHELSISIYLRCVKTACTTYIINFIIYSISYHQHLLTLAKSYMYIQIHSSRYIKMAHELCPPASPIY